jgi:hypothetical protein
MWNIVIFAVAAAATHTIYALLGVSPVAQAEGEKYAIMGYVLALFFGAGIGLAESIKFEFGSLPTSAWLGAMFGAAITNLVGVWMLGSYAQTMITIIVFAIGALITLRLSEFYISTMLSFEA